MKTRTPRRGQEERPAVTRVGYAPIVRVDAAQREIELCATSEAVDAHGTVFAYAASRDAFARWAGNVREMHERKAVGRRVAVRCDDDARKVYVRVRISRGAEDTWQKVLDGTLRGASIGAANVVWRHQRSGERPAGEEEGQDIPIATRYDLVELSLVDLPSNPDALGIMLVRDGVPVAELLDVVEESDEEKRTRQGVVQGRLLLEEVPVATAHPAPGYPADAADAIAAAALARGRLAVSGPLPPAPSPARGGGAGGDEHGAAKRARLAALGAPGFVVADPAMNGRGTDGTVNGQEGLRGVHAVVRAPDVHVRESPANRARGPFSANAAGAPDMGVPARAEERPTRLPGVGAPGERPEHDDADRETVLHTAARDILRGCGCIACQMALAALDGDGGEDGYNDDGGATRHGADHDAADRLDQFNRLAAARLTRTLDAHSRRLDASIHAVHQGVGQLGALLTTIERRVAAIEEQPMPGGPQLRVADKTHALLPGGGQSGAHEQLRALQGLAGRLSDPQAQIAVATEMIRLQQEAAGLAPNLQAMPRAGSGGY